MKQYFGKYRGVVESNADPLSLGRLKVSVATVFGKGQAAWAMPCVPYAGKNVGFFMMPPEQAHVWVEFEHGNPDNPIWVGGYWESSEAPKVTASADVRMIQTEGALLKFDNSSGGGGCTIELGDPITSTPTTISLTKSGIEIVYGAKKIKLSTTSVSVNDNVLEVL